MTTKRKCKFCDATTYKSLEDFQEIGWIAISFGSKKAICACKKHTENLGKEMQKIIGEISDNEKKTT